MVHPVIRRFRRLVAAGFLLAGAAPLAGLAQPVASPLIVAASGMAFCLARTTILYRSGVAPGGLDPRDLRRRRVFLAWYGTTALLLSFMLSLVGWSRGLGP